MANLAVVDKIEAIAGQPKSRFMLALAQSMPQGVGILPAALVRGALSAIKASESLQRCSEYSLFTSIAEVAQTGLSLDTHLGQAFLVPFSNQATVMYGYRGLCELARRSGEVDDIVGEIVYSKDEFHLALGSHRDLIHVPFSGPPSERGVMLGAYAIAEMRHGRPAFEYMTMEEIDRIKNAVIKRKKSDKPSPWEMEGAVGEMIRKTPVRRLGKRLPQSPSLIPFVQASIRDEYRQAGIVKTVEMTPAVEIALEAAEIEPEPENPPAKRESQIKEKPQVEKPDTTPITGDQFDQIYKLIADLRLTVADDLIPTMRAMGHKGSPRQFPAAKFQELVGKVMGKKK
jgi:recombination protein RecT